MATVIDSLLVSLGLETSKFTAGRKQISDDLKRSREKSNQAAKEIEAAGKKAAAFFSRMRNEAIGLFAVFAGATGLKELARNVTNADAAIGRMSTNIGISTRELAQYEGAVEQIGGTADATASSFLALSQSLQEIASKGTSPIVPFLQNLHVDAIDPVTRKVRSLSDVLRQLHEALAGKTPQEQIFLGRGLGLDAYTAQLLGQRDLQARLNAQERHGTPSTEDTKRAQELQNAFSNVQNSLTGVWRVILNQISPAITTALNNFSAWLDKVRQSKEFADQIQRFKNFIEGIDWEKVLKSVTDFKNDVSGVITHLGGWIRVTETLFALWVGAKFLAVLANLRLAAGLLGGGALGRLLSLLPALAPLLLTGGAGGEDPEFSKRKNDEWRQGRLGNDFLSRFGRWLFGTETNVLGKWLGSALGMTLAAPLQGGGATRSRAHPASYTTTDGGTGGTWGGGGRSGGSKGGKTAISGMGAGGSGDTGGTPGGRRRSSGGGTIGMRTNNPLNLMAAPGQAYEVAQDGEHVGVFPTMQAGIAAAVKQLLRYQDVYHLRTLRQIVQKWVGHTPPPQYLDAAARALGVGADDAVNLHNQRQMEAYLRAVAPWESGRLKPGDVAAGVAAGLGLGARGSMTAGTHPKAPLRSAAADLITGARARAAAWGHVVNHNTSSNEVHLNGPVNVHTQAKDAQGIAKALGGALKNHVLAANADYSLA